MAAVQESVDVDVPVTTAYNQWTQFESFPQFMDGVESITQTSETSNHWVTKIGGVERAFDAEITEQHPDERVAWKSVDGKSHAGVVTFHRLGDQSCRVNVQIEWDPESLLEKLGSVVGADTRMVRSSLQRFKRFIESRDSETGAWRADVSAPGSAAAAGETSTDSLDLSSGTGSDLTPGTVGSQAGGLDGTAGGIGGPKPAPLDDGNAGMEGAESDDRPPANPAQDDPDSGTAQSR